MISVAENRSTIIALGIALISFFLLTAALMPFSLLIPSPSLKEGEVSPRDIRAFDDLLVKWAGGKVVIRKGDIILREGDRATSKDIAAILENERARKKGLAVSQLGSMILSFSLIALVYFYLLRYSQEILKNGSELALLSFLPLIWLFLIRILLLIPSFPKYLIPFATPPMLIAVLLDQKTAIFLTIPFSLAIGVATGFELGPLAMSLAGGVVSISFIRGMRRTMDLSKAGATAGLGGGLVVISMDLVGKGWGGDVLRDLICAFGGGISSSILAVGVLPLLEFLLGMYTDARLLELSNLDHPLLRKLASVAPGTYHHSIIVGNLAEAAATAVGANPILAKVGGYFHDTGKVMRPSYFIENMNGKRSRHEKLAPSLSSLILISHVKDGVEIAKKYRLPKPIIDIIQQHHGKSLTYFYHKAKEDGEETAEEVYRYPGPKPRTKEAALVMIADCVESGSRSIQNPSPSSISDLVEEIIEDKIEDEQLDECDLTMKDLHKIADVMKRSLMAMMHGRIKYPEKETDGGPNNKYIGKEGTDSTNKEGGKKAPREGRG